LSECQTNHGTMTSCSLRRLQGLAVGRNVSALGLQRIWPMRRGCSAAGSGSSTGSITCQAVTRLPNSSVRRRHSTSASSRSPEVEDPQKHTRARPELAVLRSAPAFRCRLGGDYAGPSKECPARRSLIAPLACARSARIAPSSSPPSLSLPGDKACLLAPLQQARRAIRV
jgi:hypothetical protein